jgi:hypothetical protein
MQAITTIGLDFTALASSGSKDRSWKSGLRLDMALLVTGASASSQLPWKRIE